MTVINVGARWTVDQAYMLGLMIARVKERNRGKEIYIREIFPPLSLIHEWTVLGMFSWSSFQGKWRMLLEPHAYNYGGGWCTPSDIARDYLSIKYADRRIRCTTRQYQACCVNIPQTPLYAQPAEGFEGVYLDISGAYWQIVQAFGWDVDYCPERYIGRNSTMQDFPFPDNKLARNCMVSIGLPGAIHVWTGTRLETQRKKNKFVNLILWKAVQDVLHGVAQDAVSAGAMYVYTDGFICDSAKEMEVSNAIERWGLSLRVKFRGECTVRGVGDYDIPGHISKRRMTNKPKAHSNLYEVNREWLRKRFSKMAANRDS